MTFYRNTSKLSFLWLFISEIKKKKRISTRLESNSRLFFLPLRNLVFRTAASGTTETLITPTNPSCILSLDLLELSLLILHTHNIFYCYYGDEDFRNIAIINFVLYFFFSYISSFSPSKFKRWNKIQVRIDNNDW